MNEKRVAVVTGGSRGIGKALLKNLNDYKLATCSRSVEELEELKNEMDVFIEVCDVSNKDEVKRFVRHVIDFVGVPYLLINNAAILGEICSIVNLDEAVWDKVISINLSGTFYITKGFLKYMTQKNSGVIINITTGVASNIRANWGAYAVSKYALEGFTRLLADELKNTGIYVYAVNPGRTRTLMRKKAYPAEDPATLPDPAQVAAKIVSTIQDAHKLHGLVVDLVKW